MKLVTGRQYSLGPNRTLYVLHEDRADHVKLSIVEKKNGGTDRKTIELPLEDAFNLGRYFGLIEKSLHDANR